MERKPYPSDLNDAEWKILEPLIPQAGGKPRSVNMCEIINSIFYELHSGCAWRMLPHDLPPRQTVYHHSFKTKCQQSNLLQHPLITSK
jgi:putative transposase